MHMHMHMHFPHHLRLSTLIKRHGIADVRCESERCASESVSINFTQVSGEVTYNGQPLSTFLPQRTAAYVPQVLFPLSHA